MSGCIDEGFYQKNDLEFFRLAQSNNEVFMLKRDNC